MQMNDITGMEFRGRINGVQEQLPSKEKTRELEEKGRPISKDTVRIHVEEANRQFESRHTNLRFKIHEDLSRIYVQVIDRQSEEVIREVPPEKLLDLNAAILKQAGVIIDVER